MNMDIDFLSYMLCEDLASEVMNLQSQLQRLQQQKIQRTKPLDDQIQRITKVLAVKQKQLAQQTKRDAQTNQTANVGANPATMGTTP